MTDEIKPFQVARPPRAGLFKRLTGRISREAAFVEIRNSLAPGNWDDKGGLAPVSVGELSGILSRAKLEPREVVPELTAIYRYAALILAADRDLTPSDRAALDNLQQAFQLTDSEASAARADATSDIFERAIHNAVADGQWSPADQAKADATAKALGLAEQQARDVFKKAALAEVHAFIAAAVADRRLHRSEEAQLHALAASLGITITVDGEDAINFERFRQLAAMEEGVLPSVPVPIMPDTRDWWTEIQGLKEAKQYPEMERVLLDLLDSVERESRIEGLGVAPAGYWELAVLYRKLKRASDEIAILERFEKQQHAPGAMPRKLLERLMKLSGREIPLPPKPVYEPRTRRHNFMAVVGESFRQDVLRAALEAHGHAENAVVATLECEPQNEEDANAVAVKIGGQLVGYLDRDVAERFRPFIAASPTPVTCKAKLLGGTEDKPSIGIVVDFSPVYMLKEGQGF